MTVQKRTFMPDWADLRVFLALARAGSLSGAARTLGLNHATVHRRLAALEAEMGSELVERRARGWVLTAAGRKVAAAAETMAEAVDALGRTADSDADEIAGTVRISATEGVGVRLVVPLLPDLLARHAGLRIELLADNRSVSLARREADLALRWRRPDRGELVGRKLGSVPYHLYRRRGTPATARIVGFDAEVAFLPEAGWMARHFPDTEPVIATNSLTIQRAAVAAGLGMALLPDHMAGSDLTPVDAGGPALRRELWLLMHRDLRHLPRVRAVADHLGRHVPPLLRERKDGP